MFPLNLVAFPDEPLNLHIFEPRYRQLVKECVDEGKSFGIPPVVDNKPSGVGTAMKILEISHAYPDGKMDIKTLGVQKFKIRKFFPRAKDKFYPGADVVMLPDNSETDIVKVGRVVELIQRLYETMRMNTPAPEVSMDFRIYSVAHKIGLNFEQEVELLNIHSEMERLEYIESHLMQLIPVVNEMEELRKKIQMNGHFKNVIPPDFEL